jgi:hypothetical protein
MKNFDIIGDPKIKEEVKYYLYTVSRKNEMFHSAYFTSEEAFLKLKELLKLSTFSNTTYKVKKVTNSRHEVEIIEIV